MRRFPGRRVALPQPQSMERLIRRKEFRRRLEEGHDEHRNRLQIRWTGPAITSRLKRNLAAGVGHRHTGLTQLATPAHLLATLSFFRSELRVWHDTRNDRPSEEHGRKNRGENRRAFHRSSLFGSSDLVQLYRTQTGWIHGVDESCSPFRGSGLRGQSNNTIRMVAEFTEVTEIKNRACPAIPV